MPIKEKPAVIVPISRTYCKITEKYAFSDDLCLFFAIKVPISRISCFIAFFMPDFPLYAYVYADVYVYSFFLLQELFRLTIFCQPKPLYNIYHIYPILKMPLSGLPAWIAGKGKVPKTRNYTTKNSKLEYQFLDDP